MKNRPLIGINADYRATAKGRTPHSYIHSGYYDCLLSAGALPVIIPPLTKELDLSPILDRLDDMRAYAGAARVSVQVQVAYVHSEDLRSQVTQTALRRFGPMGPVVGTSSELVEYFGNLASTGVERVYAWFCDFASEPTLEAFGQEVIAPLASPF